MDQLPITQRIRKKILNINSVIALNLSLVEQRKQV
jgi:hypothetical protein